MRLVSVVLLAMACDAGNRRQTDTARAATPASAPTPPAAAPVVTEIGYGRIRAGMTIAEARAALGGVLEVPPDADHGQCAFGRSAALPAGVSLLIEEGVVGRVNVDSGAIATAEGARIGDTEARIREIYGDRMTVSPHKYTSGHYLTVVPANRSDTLHRIIFETESGRVARLRAGKLPQVRYVEGCG